MIGNRIHDHYSQIPAVLNDPTIKSFYITLVKIYFLLHIYFSINKFGGGTLSRSRAML